MANTRLNIIINGEDRASGAVRGITGSLNNLGGIVHNVGRVAAIGLGAVTAAAGAAAVGLGRLAAEAAPVENLQNAFGAIAERMGQDSDTLLASMQQATGGMISMRDILTNVNSAAQLVGDQFAAQLPEAMGLIQQVAASTGADFNFLVNSFITGIGRESEMILDNLQVQVDAVAAREAYAASINKTVDELSAEERQMALTAAVMEALRDNVGGLPDASESAAAQMAQLQARLQDTKDEIGLALLPVWSELLDILGRVANQVLPPLTSFLGGVLAPVLSNLVQGIRFAVEEGDLFNDFFANLWQIVPGLEQPIRAILSALQGFEGSALQGALQNLVGAFQEQLPAAQATAQAFTEWLRTAFGELGPQILDNLTTAINALAELWRAHGDEIMEIVRFAFEGIAVTIGGAITLISGIISAFLQLLNGDTQGALATLQGTWSAFMNSVLSIVGTDLQSFTAVWRNNFELVKVIVQTSLERVGAIISSIIDRIRQLGQALSNIQLPDWMTPGSPSPWELSLGRTNDLLNQMAGKAVPSLGNALGGPLGNGAISPNGMNPTGGSSVINLTINTNGVMTEAMWNDTLLNLDRVAQQRGMTILQGAG